MRHTRIIVKDGIGEIYDERIKNNYRRKASPTLTPKNKTDEEMAKAMLQAKLSKEKRALAVLKRQRTKEKKRRNISRNNARAFRLKNTSMMDATAEDDDTHAHVSDKQEYDDIYHDICDYEWLQLWLHYYN